MLTTRTSIEAAKALDLITHSARRIAARHAEAELVTVLEAMTVQTGNLLRFGWDRFDVDAFRSNITRAIVAARSESTGAAVHVLIDVLHDWDVIADNRP